MTSYCLSYCQAADKSPIVLTFILVTSQLTSRWWRTMLVLVLSFNSWLTSLRIDKFFHLIMTSCSPPFWLRLHFLHYFDDDVMLSTILMMSCSPPFWWWRHVLRHCDNDVTLSTILMMTSCSRSFWWWRHILPHFDDEVMISAILFMTSYSPTFWFWRHDLRHFVYDVILPVILIMTSSSPPFWCWRPRVHPRQSSLQCLMNILHFFSGITASAPTTLHNLITAKIRASCSLPLCLYSPDSAKMNAN